MRSPTYFAFQRSGRAVAATAVAIALVAGSVVAFAFPAAAASPSWKVVPSPSPASLFPFLNDVSCATATNCFAVGQAEDNAGNIENTLVEQWNGKVWAIVPSPNPTVLPFSVLAGVSCSSTTSCFAVGSHTDGRHDVDTLVEHWNGKVWAIVPSPNATGLTFSLLLKVWCASATSCVAVGFNDNASRTASTTLVEQWNGKVWSIVASPNPTARPDSLLYSVSCSSATNCFAVGWSQSLLDPDTVKYTLIEHWNGKAWAIVASPNRSTAPNNNLYGVACVSTTNCFAIGASLSLDETADSTLVEHWNGKGWSIVASPNAPALPNSTLDDMSCVSATSCVAVGYDSDATNTKGETLVEHWNGKTWSIQPSPNATALPDSYFEAVTCASATSCVAVGYDSDAAGTTGKTLVERFG